jgi:phage-related protein
MAPGWWNKVKNIGKGIWNGITTVTQGIKKVANKALDGVGYIIDKSSNIISPIADKIKPGLGKAIRGGSHMFVDNLKGYIDILPDKGGGIDPLKVARKAIPMANIMGNYVDNITKYG